MANTFNLIGNDNAITFNIGDLSLVFNPTDAKSEALSKKATELHDKAESLSEGDEWENRKNIKELLDDFFKVMFDETVPAQIYGAVGENTVVYLKVFLQISEALRETQKKQENDEIFKKYLAE